MIDYKSFLVQILDGYRSSYDIENHEEVEEGLVANCTMHMQQTQHFIFKEFEMSSASADEYVYIFRIPHLTAEIASEYIQETYNDGFPKINLDHTSFNKQHMCTRLVVLVLCDTADDSAIKIIKKSRIHKSFQFSLKGWMEVHTLSVIMDNGLVVSNSFGRETAKFLKKHVNHYMKNMQNN